MWVRTQAGLHSITALGRADRGAGLQAAARQFESFFVSQLLKGMRSANEIFAADVPRRNQLRDACRRLA